MGRATDLPIPTPLRDLHPDCDSEGLHVAVNFLTQLAEPEVDVWDTALWDGASSTWWSGEEWLDIAGDVRGLVVDHGRNDLNGQLGASQLTFELDNSTGRYDQWDIAGNVATSPIGQRVAVWLEPDQWLFYGRIARWEQDFGSGPDPELRAKQSRVTVEAFDACELLAQQIDGIEYRIGREGDSTPARLAYLAAVASFTRGLRLSTGLVTHRDMASVNPILETMQVTAESDGGIVFIDVDGALTFLDRVDLEVGRSDVTQPVAVFSDGCEPGSWVFWEGDPVTDDRDVRTEIVLSNVDLLQARAVNQAATDQFGRRLLPLQSQTWRTQAEGDALAEWLLARRATMYFRVPSIVRLQTAPEVRIGDRVRYVRDLPSGTRVDVDLIVEGWQIDYGPGRLQLVIATTPVSAVNAYTRWDDAAAMWDDADTLWTF